jgi:hypothetical protein
MRYQPPSPVQLCLPEILLFGIRVYLSKQLRNFHNHVSTANVIIKRFGHNKESFKILSYGM